MLGGREEDGNNVPHMSQQLQAERMRVERQTLFKIRVSMRISFSSVCLPGPVLSCLVSLLGP
jgi:hypothetical protein